MLVKNWLVVALTLGLFLALAPARAEEFGRFMTTAKERQHLDKLRQTGAAMPIDMEQAEPEDNALAEPLSAYPATVTVKGLVYRSKGKSSAWINDSNSYAGDAAANPDSISSQRIAPEKMSIALPGQAKGVRLKVGQTFDLETEQLKEMTGHALPSVPAHAADTEPLSPDEPVSREPVP